MKSDTLAMDSTVRFEKVEDPKSDHEPCTSVSLIRGLGVATFPEIDFPEIDFPSTTVKEIDQMTTPNVDPSRAAGLEFPEWRPFRTKTRLRGIWAAARCLGQESPITPGEASANIQLRLQKLRMDLIEIQFLARICSDKKTINLKTFPSENQRPRGSRRAQFLQSVFKRLRLNEKITTVKIYGRSPDGISFSAVFGDEKAKVPERVRLVWLDAEEGRCSIVKRGKVGSDDYWTHSECQDIINMFAKDGAQEKELESEERQFESEDQQYADDWEFVGTSLFF